MPRVSKADGIDRIPRPSCVFVMRATVPVKLTWRVRSISQFVLLHFVKLDAYIAVVGPVFCDFPKYGIIG